MRKAFSAAVTGMAGLLLMGNIYAAAQNTSAATTQTTPGAPAAKAPAAKTGQSAAARSTAAVPLKTQKEKFSYALGMNIGASMRKQAVPVDPASLSRGLRDSLAGGKTLLTEEEARAVLTQMQNDMRAKQQEKGMQESAGNKKKGEEFLAANKSKEGIVTLPSGMQYKILKQGTGPKPTASDSVVCNYRGTLLNGNEFDSSSKHGGPATFPVGGVIKGWTEALQLMPVGSKWQLFIPSDLAYGDRGAGGDIGPGATLIFEVELVSIETKAPEKK